MRSSVLGKRKLEKERSEDIFFDRYYYSSITDRAIDLKPSSEYSPMRSTLMAQSQLKSLPPVPELLELQKKDPPKDSLSTRESLSHFAQSSIAAPVRAKSHNRMTSLRTNSVSARSMSQLKYGEKEQPSHKNRRKRRQVINPISYS